MRRILVDRARARAYLKRGGVARTGMLWLLSELTGEGTKHGTGALA